MKFLFEIVESATRDLESWNSLAIAHYVGCIAIAHYVGCIAIVTLMGLPCAVPNIMGHGLTIS
jgi:hypothetical protein